MEYGHAAILKRNSTAIPEILMHSDKCAPKYFGKKFEVHIPNRSDWINGNQIHPNITYMYTDGSKMQSETGSGIYSNDPSFKKSKSLGHYSTITQAETYAIIDLCEEIKARDIRNLTIYICTDSQASLKALNSHCFTSKAMIECLEKVDEISSTNSITLLWVPGHHGIEGNEEADDAARTGSNNPFIGPEPTLGITYTTQKKLIREHFRNKHKTAWNQLEKCIHTKKLIEGPNAETTAFLLNKSRNDIITLVRILTGHCKLTAYE